MCFSIYIFYYFTGEPGVFIGKINPNNPARAFLGYVNEKESEKKIVRDVFKKGDAAFLSG
jgi:solute carrier family 27 fatty acid transporter 1/4